MRKSIFGYLIIAVVAIFFGFLWGRSSNSTVSPYFAPAGASQGTQPSTRSASLMIDYGDGRVRTYPDIAVTDNEDVLTLLQNQTKISGLDLQTKEYAGIGRLVTKIGDATGGDEGKYWQYWINNVSINQAADKQLVKPGDVIEWKFLNYKN